MTENSAEISANMERAETNLRAAKDLLEKDYYDIASARAYYSAKVAEAFLESAKGILLK